MKNNNKKKIILVYKGKLPDYCEYSTNEMADNHRDIYLICNLNDPLIKKFSKKINIVNINDYNFNLKLNYKVKNFRDKFYIKTIERYFIINNFIQKNSIKNFFHTEVDNYIYNLDKLMKILDIKGKKIFFSTRPYKQLKMKWMGCPGFLYCNDIKAFDKFCKFIEKKIKKKFFDDMKLLYFFENKYSEHVCLLPTPHNLLQKYVIKKGNFLSEKDISGLIDGGSFGIYLFGADPRNHGKPIFNLSKEIYGVSNDFDKMKIFMNKKNCYILYKKKYLNLYNIHLHSKDFKKIFYQKKYIKIIENFNKNKKSLISLNLLNIFKYLSLQKVTRALLSEIKKIYT